MYEEGHEIYVRNGGIYDKTNIHIHLLCAGDLTCSLPERHC